jgi:hypothetical protein
MCDPVTALAVGSAVSGLVSQSRQASAIGQANNRQAQATRTAQAENANQVNLSRLQETDAAGQKINDNNMALREAQATAVAQAGPTGLSLDALLGSMGQKAAGYNQSVNANLDRVNMALDNQLTNVNRSAASEVNSLKAPQAPDYLGAALRIGTSLDSAGVFKSAPAAKSPSAYLPNSLRGQNNYGD